MKLLRLLAVLTIALFTSAANAQTDEIVYYAKLPQADLSKAKTKLASLIYSYHDLGRPLSVLVLDDRIEMTFKGKKKTILNASIPFSDLYNYPIRVTKYKVSPSTEYPDDFAYRIKLKNYYIRAKIYMGRYDKKVISPITGLANDLPIYTIEIPESETSFKELADYLFYFQHLYAVQRYDSLLNVFKPVAANYCALKEKPQVSEEQRKYIVQANILNEQKNYEKAIELYNKAIELDQTAFPAAYSNLALLSAQLSLFDEAIYYMKKYLLLEPDAVEARADQDKIYEWETLMQN